MSDTHWQPEFLNGHAPYCVRPFHSLMTWCSADPAEPDTMAGKPSKAWKLDHPGKDSENEREAG